MSSDTLAIRVSLLGKKYKLGGMREPYHTFRDAMVNSLKTPFRKLSHTLPTEEFWALNDVSFDVMPGEVMGIIGRNGAGKSTILKILSHITNPTTGIVEIYGRVGSLLEIGTGFHPEMTGRENIFLNGSILGMRNREIEEKFNDIVKFSEIEKFLDTPVKRYSSGMYVRLAFAVAAHLEPEILLVDEVLAVGDLAFQKKCLGKMGEIAKEGRTVLFVSHNMGAIHNLCNKCILLEQGRLSMMGKTDEVISHYISNSVSRPIKYEERHEPEKAIHLRKVFLQNAKGNIANEFRYDQGFIICIEYEVNKKISNCSVWFGIRTLDEIIAFGSSDTDIDNFLLNERLPGAYTTLVSIPPKWLNAGRYYLVVGIVQYNPSTTYDRIETSPFTILDIGTPEKIRTGHDRPGILQPFLKWDTRAENTNQG